MSDISRCRDHGFFDESACPVCGADDTHVDGTHVVSTGRREQLSRFLSGLLRHFPAECDLHVDEQGWADVGQVREIVDEKYGWADVTASDSAEPGGMVDAVVAVDPKGRFEVDEGRIRAAYGHSIDVTLEDAAGPVPDVLYHGTAPSNVDDILADGLRPMSRQLVHLSGTVADARAVGARHAAEPVVFVVDAARMLRDGHRITKRGRSVYTTEHVPPAYLQRRDPTDE